MLATYTKIEDGNYHHMMVAHEAGDICPTHRHSFAHTTTCIEGRAKFWAEVEPATGEEFKVSFDIKQ